MPLWGAVARELRWLSSVLPLMFADLQRPWCRWLYATDAEGPSQESHGGFGVVRRPVSAEICRDLGQVSEQRRYDSEDYVEARSQALSEAQERLYQDLVLGNPNPGHRRDARPGQSERRQASLLKARGGDDDLSSAVQDGCFRPVDPLLAGHFGSWCPVVSGRWTRAVKILRGEGRAAVIGVKHCLRASANHGTRLVLLCDNLSLVLGLTKGRGRKNEINQSCREICGLCLLANIKLHVRWIPSELNPADPPSRGAQ